MELIKCILKDQVGNALSIIEKSTPTDLDFRDIDGNTALMLASKYGHTEIVSSLLTKCIGASINIQNNGGYTALMDASKYGHTENVALLLTKCSEAAINIQDKHGNTALMLVSYYGYTEIVEALLPKCSEATINIQNIDEKNALICATVCGNNKIVKKLIYISDIHIRNNENKTAFDFSNEKEIIDLFDLNTGCDSSLRFGKSISNVTLASLHSLKSDKWLNLF